MRLENMDIESLSVDTVHLGEVHLLIGFEAYYPSPDNTLRVFHDEDRARAVLEDLQELSGNPNHKELYAELKRKYEWLPEYKSERYAIVTHEVH